MAAANIGVRDFKVNDQVVITSARKLQNITEAQIAGDVYRGTTSDLMRISGGSTNSLGGRIVLYGETHASLPNVIDINNGGSFAGRIQNGIFLWGTNVITGLVAGDMSVPGKIQANSRNNSISSNGSLVLGAAQNELEFVEYTLTLRYSAFIFVSYSSSTGTAFGSAGLWTMGIIGNSGAGAAYRELIAGQKSTTADGTLSITATGDVIRIQKSIGSGGNNGVFNVTVLSGVNPFDLIVT